MREDLAQGRQLGTREAQRWEVDDVDGVDARRPQDPAHLADGLGRRQVPGHADPAERVTDDQVPAGGGHPTDPGPAVLDPDLQGRTGAHPEPFHVDGHHARVDLRDQTAGAGPDRGEVAREGQATPADVVRIQAPAGREGAGHDGRKRLGVVQLEVGRVVEVDVGVPHPVQDEQPTSRAVGVAADLGAVVLRLGGTSPRRDDARTGAEQDEHQRLHGRSASDADLDRHRPHQERHPEPDQDPGHRHPGDQHEPGHDRPEDRPGGADARDATDDGAGLGECGQGQLGDHRGDGRQQSAGDHDRQPGHHQQHGRVTELAGTADRERCHRHRCARAGEQRGDRTPGLHHVGDPPSPPRPQGDRGQRGADHQRAGLQRQPEVRRQQPQRDDLDDEDRGRGAEHQRSRGPLRQSIGRTAGLVTHAVIMTGSRAGGRPHSLPDG